MSTADLPEPDETARQHSEKLQSLIAKRIDDGAISFADYMQHALYEPGLGYYMAGAQKFGSDGDFVTAPETSPLFGQCLAQSCRSLFTHLPTAILELGAGSGKLAASIIAALDDLTQLEFWILEPSAELQQRQQQFLRSELTAGQFACITWLTTLPSEFCGVVIANEVMDALPVERIKVAESLLQAQVAWKQGKPTEQFAEAPQALIDSWQHIEQELSDPIPLGYQTELPLLLKPWIRSIADAVKNAAVLLIDYGYPRQEYYAAERVNGTLACYYQHRMHDDAYWWPGLQDITAHVDFTSVIETASDSGFELLGYTSQGSYLLDNGLTQHLEVAMTQCKSDVEQLQLSQAVKKLTLPGEMGERFQVMALGMGVEHEPTGFSLQELSHRL